MKIFDATDNYYQLKDNVLDFVELYILCESYLIMKTGKTNPKQNQLLAYAKDLNKSSKIQVSEQDIYDIFDSSAKNSCRVIRNGLFHQLKSSSYKKLEDNGEYLLSVMTKYIDWIVKA